MTPKAKKTRILLQAPKGMRDILPEKYRLLQNIYEKTEEIAEFYGFSPIQTPHLERAELFTASLGETSDIIEKQMYILKTRGGDRLALRPEGTAGIMRAYIENGMQNLPQPVMLWYKGSFFRHERPQKGRFREFQQFGLEIINEEKAVAEAAIIRTMVSALEEIGVGPVVVRINSLGDAECKNAYRKELLAYYRKNLSKLCGDCKRRYKTNPLRLLDCKEEQCSAIKEKAPQMVNYLCDPCKRHFKDVLEFLDSSGVNYFLDTHLVRGLDYYSRTVFEIFEDTQPEETDSGDREGSAKTAIAAGGRYDSMAKLLSGKDFPSAGGAIGIDRVAEILNERKIKIKARKKPKVFFIQIGTAAKYKSLEIMEMLRKARVPMSQSIGKDSLKGQLKIAAKLEAPYALILGQKETVENSIIVRDMNSREQETVPIEKVVEIIRKKLASNR
ncbi:MAG: histidine--tRNA ligase [bacterium]|nr:histidine--tRNA ligase [bacterium]